LDYFFKRDEPSYAPSPSGRQEFKIHPEQDE
jgi:hypothetical protein